MSGREDVVEGGTGSSSERSAHNAGRGSGGARGCALDHGIV